MKAVFLKLSIVIVSSFLIVSLALGQGVLLAAESTVRRATPVDGLSETERQQLDRNKEDTEYYLPILAAVAGGGFVVAGIIFLKRLAKN